MNEPSEETEPAPSPTAVNPQRPGQFQPGNKAARGNPFNARVQRIRAELIKSATPADVKAITRALVDGAKAGDLAYIREWLDRTVGKAISSDVEERIARLEQILAERNR